MITEDRFRQQPRELTAEEKRAVAEFKNLGAAFEGYLNEFVRDSREKSLALTKMEEAVMWAVKGVTA